MLRYLADEDFNNDILRGTARRLPDFDVIRIQDMDLMGKSDSVVIRRTILENRILLTHDVNTLLTIAKEMLIREITFPGIFAVRQNAPIRDVINDLSLLTECSKVDEWNNQIVYLPLSR